MLVNLHRGTKTALEWVRVLEAVTNGCAVVTEPSDDLGPLRPGEHLLVAEPDDIGRVAAELARDEPRRAALVEAAHELCRTQLDMAVPAARLVEACREALAAPAPVDLAPTAATEPGHHLAVWLPAAGGGVWAPPGLEPAPLAARPTVAVPGGPLAVLCTSAGGGRSGRRHCRLRRRRAPGGARACKQRRRRHRAPRRGPQPAHGARRRADLAVLDGGDVLIGDALERMADLLRDDPDLDAVLCPATYGDALVNALLPDERRLRERIYLTRGYVVRRSTLEALGGFTEAPELADLVDHHFWLSLTAGGGRTAMLRRIGLALWPGS